MKNWKKIMAGLCAAAMVSSMVVPVWAAEETTEEAADDGDVADVSEAMLGLWKDSAGDIYGFYKDNSFFGQWKDEEQDILRRICAELRWRVYSAGNAVCK